MRHTFKLGKRLIAGIMSTALLASSVAFTAAPTTVVAADNDNYAKLLQYSLYFYDANMCGDVSGCALNWRGNCHTSDDVVGGFHDAGDHVMFGLPQGYAASTLGWSYYEYKNSYDSLGLTSHYKMINNRFIDFFKKSTVLSGDSVSKFLYQKGEGGPDHAYWGAPEQQSGNRKMYWTTSGASDIAAEYAAALALDYINFGNKESLDYAKALYKFSTRDNQCAVEGTQTFYDSKQCADDQAWAAAWLYVATKDQGYLNDAKSKNTQYLGWAHAWGNVDLGAACVIAKETKDWSKVNGYIGGLCNGSNYLCMDDWGSARYNCGMQFVSLVSSKNSSADYASWAQGQMNIILGANGGQNYVVGWNDKSPTHCHHRAASGMSDSHSNDPNKYTLVGALVGGPNKAGVYVDQRYDEIGYQVNEVAVDYQANLVAAAAALYDKFGTGSTVTSIPGIDGSINVNPQNPDPTQAPTEKPQDPTQAPTDKPQDPTNPPSSGETKATVTEKENSEGRTYWSVDAAGASQVKVTFKTNSSDTEANGVYNPPGGWAPVDWKANPSDGTFTLTYDNDDNYSFIDIHVYWPQTCTLVEAVKIGGSTTQPTEKPTEQPTEKPTDKPTEQPTEAPQNQAKLYGDVDNNGKVDILDVIALNKNLLTGDYISEDGKLNADVDRNGAINETDSLNILKYLVELIDKLPV